MANWALVGSAVWDSSHHGPETIDLEMTGTMIGFSSLFAAFALQVQPRNMLLFSCHSFNIVAQCNQIRRAVAYKLEHEEHGHAELTSTAQNVGVGAVAAGGFFACIKPLRAALNTPGLQSAKEWLAGPAGPLTIFFWAPMSKWAISWNNIKNLEKPVDKISVAQMSALTVTGLIWTRYSFVIAPVNYNMAVVQSVCASSSGYHLARKLRANQLEAAKTTS